MRTGCACLISAGFILSGAADVDGVIVRLTAVKKNGAAIAHTSEIVAAPGDTIEAELFISGWAVDFPNGLRLYNALVKGRAGARSGSNGFVLPEGWHAPLDPVFCTTDEECSFDPTFKCLSGFCRGLNHNPLQGAFVTQQRPDFIFATGGAIFGVSTSSPDFLYFGVQKEGGVLDTGQPVYVGTLVLVVGESACGSFRFAFDTCFDATIVQSPSDVAKIPSVVPLVIQLPECPATPIASVPANCMRDARMPHLPGQPLELLTPDAIDLAFNASPAGLTPASFRTRRVPPGVVPTVAGVQVVSGNSLHVTLSDSIPPGAWTCLEHRASGREVCLASLPADVNLDNVISTVDIQDFQERPFLPVEDPNYEPGPPSGPTDDLLEWMETRLERDLLRCDIDRSGLCTPVDILTAMDLFNGSGFAVWNGAGLTSLCPSENSLDPRFPRGACCHTLFGSCVDNVLEASCQSANEIWANDTPCCEDAECNAPTGACCELATGDCRNGELQVNCQGIEEEWTMNAACAQVGCAAIRGACCNLDSGQCANNLLESQCQQQSSAIWYPGLTCLQILCSPE
jgi:hypothetical protein